MKKISMILLSIALAVSLAAVPAMAAEETNVSIVEEAKPQEKMDMEEGKFPEEEPEQSLLEKAAEKVQEVIEEAIEAVKESAETAKEKAEEEAVHAEMELDAKLSEEKEEEEYTVSTVVFTEDGMLILPRPVKEGKRFIEWNTEEDGSGYGYKAGEIVDPTDIVLYSIWEDEEKEEELKAEEEVLPEEEIENDVKAEDAEIENDVEDEPEEAVAVATASETGREGAEAGDAAEPEGAEAEEGAEE